MPMPPPRASTEGIRDRQTRHEIGQVARAVAELGPVSPTDLAEAVGARYWEPGRFEEALRLAVRDGVVVRDTQGLLTAV
jgi:hypothetical protein